MQIKGEVPSIMEGGEIGKEFWVWAGRDFTMDKRRKTGFGYRDTQGKGMIE